MTNTLALMRHTNPAFLMELQFCGTVRLRKLEDC